MEIINVEDRHYLKGFEDGCDFMLMELQRWGKEHDIYVSDILHHLKGEKIGNDKDGNKDRL
jgi:hypothetical protein